MDLSIFNINSTDTDTLAFIKREAVSFIESIDDDYIKISQYAYFSALIDFINKGKTINTTFIRLYLTKTKDLCENFLNFIPLTPITFTKNDFIKEDNHTLLLHKRCKYIIWNSNFPINSDRSIYNENAYHIKVKKIFDFREKKSYKASDIDLQMPIYISKGGIISGDYIDDCYFIKESYENNITIEQPIEMPVAKVYFKSSDDKDCLIYVVDHREPMLKTLITKYNCPILTDSKLAMRDHKLNLRYCTHDRATVDYSEITFNKPKQFSKTKYECVKVGNKYLLRTNIGELGEWYDGILTVHYSKIRYKKYDINCWKDFIGYTISQLKLLNKKHNKYIKFD